MKYIMETEDDREFKLHYNGPALYYSIHEFRQYLHNQWKYKDPESKAWATAAQELNTILIDHGINMEEDYQ